MLRQPTISNTHIAFAYANDIWIVDRMGGDARRLTVFEGAETNPMFSPDGRTIAFSGQYDGNTDVYTIPMEGGQPRRLTWHPGADIVKGWTRDGAAVIFGSGRDTAPIPYPRMWTVPLDGTMPTPLPMPRANKGQFSQDSSQFVYQQIAPWESEWRNYRGGQAQPIWLLDMNTLDLTKAPWDGSNDTDPVWLGNTVYFLSDRDYCNNIYAWNPRSGRLNQVTHFTEYDAKALQSGGGMLVFEHAGYIRMLDPRDNNVRQVNIRVRGDLPWLRPQWENLGNAIANASISPTGKRAIFEARGEIFTVPADKGDTRNLTNTSGEADRNPIWSPDGRHVAWFSDASGEYQLIIAEQDGMGEPRAIALKDPTFYFTPAWSPDSEKILYTDEGLNLWVLDVGTGEQTLVDTDQFAHPQRTIDPVWSPDSNWIAYAKRLDSQFHAIMVYSLDDGSIHQVTDGLSDCISPAWDRNGKYLYFLGSTDYALNTGWLDMSSYERPVRRAVYFAVLQADQPSPLLPQSDEEQVKADDAPEDDAADEADAAEGDDAEAAQDDDDIRIDFDGMLHRILALPMPAANYVGTLAAGEGVVFIAEQPSGGDPFGGGGGLTLHRWDMSERESQPFISGIGSAIISADGHKMLYSGGGGWGIVGTSGSANVGDGRISTSDMRARIEPPIEWRQIFREAWRYQRDFFYVENIHGADWDKVWNMYEPWLDHVAHRSDLTHLLDILGGETAIGHSFVRGGDTPDVDSVNIGLLGADLEIDQDRFRIAKIYTGENWNPTLRAPLAAPGVEVSEGDYILAVNGRELNASMNPYSLFEATANRQTVLRLSPTTSDDDARDVTVVPVASEAALRQFDWIEGNRRKVDEMSDGRLAYVWLPNTGFGGYTNFNRYYFAQQDKQGAVIDERFNGGGSAADYIVDILARKPQGFFNNPVADNKPFTNPGAGIWGPKVMIINESAGSGGDLMPWMFRNMEIGPLIGTRTWGGLVGIWDVPPLVDGGSITAPRGGFYNMDGEWAVENEGVAPDIEVEQLPKQVAAGRDPQLEAAVKECLRLLETKQWPRILPQPPDPIRARRPGDDN